VMTLLADPDMSWAGTSRLQPGFQQALT